MVSKFRVVWVAIIDIVYLVANYPGNIFWRGVSRIVKVKEIE